MIRAAGPADAAAIAEIWNAIIRDTTQTFTTAEKTAEGIAGQVQETPFLVATEADRVLGFVTWFQFRGGPGYAHTMEHSIHVRPDARGAGIGRTLMTACEAQARAEGVHSLFAGVAGENAGGVAFHAALGYREVARLPEVGWKFGRWHDLTLMQKML